MYYPIKALSIFANALLISSIAFLPTHFISKSSHFFFFSRSSTYKILFLINAFLVLSLRGSASIGIVLILASSWNLSCTLSRSSISTRNDLSMYILSKMNNLAYEANTSHANIMISFGETPLYHDLISITNKSLIDQVKSSITSSTSYFT